MPQRRLPHDVSQTAIAKAVGLSEATVSRALRNPDAKTRSAMVVRQYLDEQGIVLSDPHSLEHRQALLIVPNRSNMFFSELENALSASLLRIGVSLITADARDQFDEEKRWYEYYSRVGIDAIVYIPSAAERDLVSDIVKSGIPLVVVDRKSAAERTGSSVCRVSVDNAAGIRAIVDHLYGLSHRRIGFVTGPSLLSSAEERYDAFIGAMNARGINVDFDWIFHGDFSRESGSNAGREYVQRRAAERPTAIICSNDDMAIGFLRALHRSNVRVPQDVSLVGFDGTRDCEWTFPALASVAQQIPKVVAAVCRLLNRQLKGDAIDDPAVTIRPILLVNESVGVPFDRDALAS